VNNASETTGGEDAEPCVMARRGIASAVRDINVETCHESLREDGSSSDSLHAYRAL
jgi:hypothetical protein